jgi:hypothetical protein
MLTVGISSTSLIYSRCQKYTRELPTADRGVLSCEAVMVLVVHMPA